jgi:acyl dehydratase
MSEQGPGEIPADEVGCFTIAKTTLLDARRIMAYAAAINDTNEAYFDDLRPGGLNVHPAICFSLQWNSRFLIDRPTNMRAAPFGVHAETDLRLYQPFKQGEAITTQGQLVARKQIGPGVYSVDRFRMTNGNGELVAELDYNGIIRGGLLVGDTIELEPSPAKPVCENPGIGPIWSEVINIPLHAGQQYTECADIYNPIHTEPSVAKLAGLPEVILHGSATKAHALTQVINHCFDGDASRIRRLCGQLRGMVLMDSNIRVECTGVQDQGDERQVFFHALNDMNELAISNGIVCGTLPV